MRKGCRRHGITTPTLRITGTGNGGPVILPLAWPFLASWLSVLLPAAEGAALFTLAVAAIKLNPNLTWSCKVTGIDAMSSASNIIPDKARIMIDARAQTNELMDEMLSKIDAAVKGAAAAIGGKGSTRLMGTVIPAAEYDEEYEPEENLKDGYDEFLKHIGGERN